MPSMPSQQGKAARQAVAASHRFGGTAWRASNRSFSPSARLVLGTPASTVPFQPPIGPADDRGSHVGALGGRCGCGLARAGPPRGAGSYDDYREAAEQPAGARRGRCKR